MTASALFLCVVVLIVLSLPSSSQRTDDLLGALGGTADGGAGGGGDRARRAEIGGRRPGDGDGDAAATGRGADGETTAAAEEEKEEEEETAAGGSAVAAPGGSRRRRRRREMANIFGGRYETMAESGYGCYRTVDGTFQTMRSIARAHPDLAQLVDIGDSYDKVTPRRRGGSNLWVLKLTNKSRPGGHLNKGILFAIFGLHPREYAPPELGARFAELLVGGYGADADVTALLNHTEIHLLLQANPDGRRVAEADRRAWWRKNRNPNDGCRDGGAYGVDLNRNFDFMWGWSDGSSSDPCSGTYRGRRPFSEPESTAIARYAKKIFPRALRRLSDGERRADVPFDEDSAEGMFLDVHAYANLVIWPWGYKDEEVPNYHAYQALGHKLCSFNGYEPSGSGMENFMYEASGTAQDYMWGILGVPSILIELGDRFDPPCDGAFQDDILPGNLGALMYAAKVSRSPFRTAKGPDVTDLTLSSRRIRGKKGGGTLTVSARVSDLELTNLRGEDPVRSGRQAVRQVRLYVDGHPNDDGDDGDGDGAASYRRMRPADGRFDSHTEWAELEVPSSDLRRGRHHVCVVGIDSRGYAGLWRCEYFGVGCTPGEDCDRFSLPEGGADCSGALRKRKCRRTAGCHWTKKDPDAGTPGSCVSNNNAQL